MIGLVGFLFYLLFNYSISVENTKRFEQIGRQDFPIIEIVNDNWLNLLKIESSFSEAILEEDEEALERAQKNAQLIRDSFNHIAKIDPTLTEQINSLRIAFVKYFDRANYVAKEMIEGDDDHDRIMKNLDSMREELQLFKSKQKDFKEKIHSQFSNKLRQSKNRADLSLRLGVLIGVTLIIILLFASYLINNLITHPLYNIINIASQLSEGNWSVEIGHDALEGEDELAKLNQAFNSMKNHLQSNFQDLEVARDQALAADRAKTQFLANMSHEIRTPMNAVIGNISILLGGKLPKKYMQCVRRIDDASRSLLMLIDDILDLTKLDINMLDIELIEFDLEAMLETQIDTFGVQVEESHLELILSIDNNVPNSLIGDPKRICQVVNNLIDNALKFTSQGEIELAVSLKDKTIDAVCLQFSVRDTGMGINDDYLPQLFNRFTQEDTSTTRNFSGSGLGLSIAKKLVNLMRGDLWVDTAVDRGSTFSFSLPFTVAGGGVEASASEPPKVLTSLIINSNVASAESLTRYLESWQVRCKVAPSLDDALSLLRHKPVDLILIDENAVDDSAIVIAALNEMIDEEWHQSTVIVYACFTYLLNTDELKTMQLATHLDKPIKVSQLRALLESIRSGTLLQVVNEEQPQQPSMQASTSHEPQYRVLVVDDVKANQQLAVFMLDDMGIGTEVAENGKKALERVRSDYFDLVLMDIQMPVMGGFEATELIRQDQEFKDLPIIAVTASALVGSREDCINAGMNDYLSKPFDFDQLDAILKKWLD